MKGQPMRNLPLIVVAVAALALFACRKEADAPPAGSGGNEASSPSAEAGDGEGRPSVGEAMPEFEARYLDGKSFRVSDQKGRVVLLNIWATWCGPCRYEIPELKKLQQEHGSSSFDVVGVSVDDAEQKAEVSNFAKSQKINYPIVLDPAGKLAEMFETSVIPTSALIDRKGRIVWYHIGIVRSGDPDLQKALKRALDS
jgi:thiol-disulfide isomerase/thioredoxin